MRNAAALRALRLLLRRHPRVAAELAGAAVWQAGRVGLADLRSWFRARTGGPDPEAPEPKPPVDRPRGRKPPTRLTRRERRQLRRLATRWAEPPERPTA